MANKLPWMKHDHNARNDDFVKRACGRFGHFGYAGWFRLLETVHEHGVGDNLCMTRSRLASELGSKWPPVRNLLDFCRESGKVQYNESGEEVRIVVKNFRKKQEKKSFKPADVSVLDLAKQALEEEGEVEGENDRLRDRAKALVKSLAVSFGMAKWTDAELEEHRFPFGNDKGRRIIDLEPSRCQWYLDRFTLDSKTKAALRHRIELKREETARG